MTSEEHLVANNHNHELPPANYCVSIVALAASRPAADVLCDIQTLWRTVASWGTWCDEELQDWPSTDECMEQIPVWFRSNLADVDVENWLEDLHGREWIWWSSCVVDRLIVIDLSVGAMPSPFWMIEEVLFAAGCEILYRDKWKSLPELIRVVEGNRSTSGH